MQEEIEKKPLGVQSVEIYERTLEEGHVENDIEVCNVVGFSEPQGFLGQKYLFGGRKRMGEWGCYQYEFQRRSQLG
jgi:hypothetical protein